LDDHSWSPYVVVEFRRKDIIRGKRKY